MDERVVDQRSLEDEVVVGLVVGSEVQLGFGVTTQNHAHGLFVVVVTKKTKEEQISG